LAGYKRKEWTSAGDYSDLPLSFSTFSFSAADKRFVRKLRALQPERIWRLECQPGEE
jgi:hypothetical protein